MDAAKAPTAGAARSMPKPREPTAKISLANTGKSAVAPPNSTPNKSSSKRGQQQAIARQVAEALHECCARPKAHSSAFAWGDPWARDTWPAKPRSAANRHTGTRPADRSRRTRDRHRQAPRTWPAERSWYEWRSLWRTARAAAARRSARRARAARSCGTRPKSRSPSKSQTCGARRPARRAPAKAAADTADTATITYSTLSDTRRRSRASATWPPNSAKVTNGKASAKPTAPSDSGSRVSS